VISPESPVRQAKPTPRAELLWFLDAQRGSVRAIVDGLTPQDAGRAVLPSGWAVAGMVAHLAGAEDFWFRQVLAGGQGPPPWRDGDADVHADGVFGSTHALPTALRWYGSACAASNSVMEDVDMDASPRGPVLPDLADEIHTARGIVLHMIEETARHAGHLDAARELLDGVTGLGPR
jgi:uncharacterized damage-inducible protein DinB